ncbi:unnamed protein product [Calypogeia fissa]
MESKAEIADQEEALMKQLAELRASKKKKISKECSSKESPRRSGRLQTKVIVDLAESNKEMPHGEGFVSDDGDEENDPDDKTEISEDGQPLQPDLEQPIANQVSAMSKGRKGKQQSYGATTRPLQGGSNSVGAEYERRGGEVDVEYGRSASLGQLGGETPPMRRYSLTDHYSGKVSLGQYGGEVPFWSGAYRGPPAYQGRDPMQGNYDKLVYHSFDGGRRSYQDGKSKNPLPGAGSMTPNHTTNSSRARPKVNVNPQGWVLSLFLC